MSSRTRVAALAILCLGAVAAVRVIPSRATAGRAGEAAAAVLRVRDADIAFYERRVAGDPQGALDRMRLGVLRLERARATGDERELVQAESLARESLALRIAHNAAAWRLLAAALLGQHRFVEALSAAEQVLRTDPESPGARALRGEILLELGRYSAADSVFAGLAVRRMEPAVSPRYARWLELRGRVGDARRLLERARDHARAADAPADQLAWFDLRLGDLALRYGRLGEAHERVDAGLRAFPDDWRFLALAARIELAQGRSMRAIGFGDSSLARHVDPATLALLGDAWLAVGDTERAESYFRALEHAAGGAPRGGFHRSWYLALLDHDRKVPEVLAAVTRDIETRPDVYGWDLLAWALYRSGHVEEARIAITNALAWGTEDPQLAAHARAIREAQ